MLVQDSLYGLYNDYVNAHSSRGLRSKDVESVSSNILNNGKKITTKNRAEFDLWVQDEYVSNLKKFDLDVYLEKGIYFCKGDSDVEFCALD